MTIALLKLTSVRLSGPNSHFGKRKLPNGVDNYHEGTDHAFGQGVPISAAGAGVVIESPQKSKHWKYGWYCKIQHPGKGGRIATSYHSADGPCVPVGTKVNMGDTVGFAGQSALSASGPHLHFGLWFDGTPVDPFKYLVPGKIVTVSWPQAGPVKTGPNIPTSTTTKPNTGRIPNGDKVFIAVRNGSFFLALPVSGQYTLVPLGKNDVTEDVPIVRFVTKLAWDTFKTKVTNPIVLGGK